MNENHKVETLEVAWASALCITGVCFLLGVVAWQTFYLPLTKKAPLENPFLSQPSRLASFTAESEDGTNQTENINLEKNKTPLDDSPAVDSVTENDEPVSRVVSHLKTPEPLKAVYMTSWTASSKKARGRLVQLIEDTELNSVVIDVKDERGIIPFLVSNPILDETQAAVSRVQDFPAFLEELHTKEIYTIARIPVFEDSYFVARYPEEAVKKKDLTIWSNHKGLFWVDPGSQKMWEYISALAKEAHNLGFDEINFDYVRFPSDGDLTNIFYPRALERPKREVIREFFLYLRDHVASQGIPISADLFGLTTTAYDDLNIGQVFEDALLAFDFVSPMVYPSHYAPYSFGLQNPNFYPYATISGALAGGVHRASTSGVSLQKIRPWLQDFDLGAQYGTEEVRLQIQAVYDVGLTSWMLWDPTNIYTRSAIQPI